MNKVLTITGAFFSTLLVTLLAAGVAVQSPKVQTWIGKKAVAKIEKQLGGHFTFDEVRLNPFDALVLKNVVILDDSPYTGRPQQAVVDTFARADRIAVLNEGALEAFDTPARLAEISPTYRTMVRLQELEREVKG